MRQGLWQAVIAVALLAASAAHAQAPSAPPAPPPPGMPPSDEGLTRGALKDALTALGYSQLNKRAVAIEALANAADARARQQFVRETILALIGGLPDRTNPLNARITRTSAGEGFRVQNIVFDSLPGMHVTANLYLPAADAGARLPAIVAFPGHAPAGKLSYYAFGAYMARQGVAVLSVDLPGEGEMLQYADPATGESRVGRPTSEHGMDAYAVAATGDHVSRYFVNLAMRAIDYLASRPDIDPAGIGVFGCSGGGTVAAYVAALDARVRATAVACYMNDFAHVLPVQGPQEAEQTIPRFLSSGLDLPDWMELAAPRPYAIVSTTEDFFPFTGGRAAFDEGRGFWSLFGEKDKLVWIHGPGGHGNLGPVQDRIADFFHEALGSGFVGDRLPPPGLRVPDEWAAKLRVTDTGQVVPALGGATIQSVNAARARQVAARPAHVESAAQAAALNARLAGIARERAAIAATAGAPPKVELAAAVAEDGLTVEKLSFESPFGLLPAAFIRARPDAAGPVMLLIEERGLDVESSATRALVAAGWQVLAIHARGADGIERGGADLLGNQNRMALRALIVGRTLPGIRADDLIGALNWLESRGVAKASLMATGSATVPAAHVALLDGRIVALVLQSGLVSWRKALSLPMQRNLAPATIPGALRDYDLPDLITATRACRIVVAGPVDGLGAPLDAAQARTAYGEASAWLNKGGERLTIAPGDWTPAALRCREMR